MIRPKIPYGNYTFLQLEKFLSDKPGTYLIVASIEYPERATMHIFGNNFCGDWVSGDGVLFYANGEVHGANPSDEFKLIAIKHPDE